MDIIESNFAKTGNTVRIKHIILLRALTILLVVLGHSTRSTDSPAQYLYNPINTPFFEILLLKYIYSFHMPLFFWISGYILYFSISEKKDHISPVLELWKKIKRLIIPLYATSFFVLLPTIFLFGQPDGSLIHMCKKFIIGKDIAHLWFLKSLFYIFIVVIPVSTLLKKASYLQGIFICVSIMFLSFSKLIFPRFLRDLMFFLCGYYTRKFSRTFLKQNTLVLFFIFSITHTALFIFTQQCLILKNPVIIISKYFTPLSGIYFMYYISIYFSKLSVRYRFWHLVTLVDKRSYTIYLFHSTLIFAVFYTISFFPKANALSRIIFSTLLGIIIPILLHHFISKIKYVSFLFSIPYYKYNNNDQD